MIFASKKYLELIKKMIAFQTEVSNRVKAVRDAGNVDYPYVYDDGDEKYYIGSVVQAPNGYQVEYTDNIGPYGEQGLLKIFANDERFADDRTLLYAGMIDEKRPFVIGRMQMNGSFVSFPRMDNYRDYFQKFTGSEEEMA